MADEKQRYLGQFSITDATKNFTVGGFAGVLTTGDYYMSGSGSTQLVEHMQVVIRALNFGFSYASATVTMSNTTGKITISLGKTDDIVWTDASLGTILGFEVATIGSDEYIAAQQARYCWFPPNGLSLFPGIATDWWAPKSTTKAHISANGQTYSRKGNLLYDGRFEYRHLLPARVWKSGSAWWDSFESFFEDVIHEGAPIRCFPDRDQDSTSADYKTAMWAPDEGKPVGSFSDLVGRNIKEYNGYWRVALRFWKHVT